MRRILPVLWTVMALGGIVVAVPVAAQEGACCFPPCYDCVITTEEACLAQGGYYAGDYTTCDPNP